MDKVTETGLDVELLTGVQVTPQPDENKYYMRGGESDHPGFVQSDRSNQSHVKSPGGSRAVWVAPSPPQQPILSTSTPSSTLSNLRTSYILPSGVDSVANDLFPSADNGCAATFTFNGAADSAVGTTGAQTKAVFENRYQNDNVKVCGRSYLNNGSHITVDESDNCEPAVPCANLNAENIANDYPCHM